LGRGKWTCTQSLTFVKIQMPLSVSSFLYIVLLVIRSVLRPHTPLITMTTFNLPYEGHATHEKVEKRGNEKARHIGNEIVRVVQLVQVANRKT
jgi:hypothetical protein